MQITIPTLQLDRFRPQGLPGATSGTCSAVVGSHNLSGNFNRWVGLVEGFMVNVDGDDYTVVSVHPTLMVIEPAYSGDATSNVPFTVYPYVFLRLYALQPFTAESDQQIIQPGAPGNGNFYKQACCSAIGSKLYLPELAVESTVDALNPSERSARYFAGFYRPDGSLIQPYYKFEQFALMATPATQTWADIAGYNSRGAPPPLNYDTYTRIQIDELFTTGTLEVLPPLVFDGTTLYIPKASATQDGYLSKEDYQMFLEGMDMGISQINAGTGLVTDTGLPITDAGTLLMADQPDLLEGVYVNPMLTVNKQGQITHIESGSGGPVTQPVISAVASSAVIANAATITWDTDVPSDSQVEYGIGSAYDTAFPVPPNPSPQIHHSVRLLGLAATTTYTYRVKSANSAGTTTSTTTDTFTTPVAADTTAPVIDPGSINASPIGLTTATIVWTTTGEASTSQVDYGTSVPYSNSTVPNTTPVFNHSVPLTLLTSGVTYHYRVRSKDAATPPNEVVSGDFTFMTTAADVTAPTVSGEYVDTITGTTAVVHWTTSELADSQVGYGTSSGSYATLAPPTPTDLPPSSMQTIHAVPLSGLNPATTYHYQCKSRDAVPNLGLSIGDRTFITDTLMDPTVGLISYWKMDETSGDRLDTVGANVLHELNTPGYGAGLIGNAVRGVPPNLNSFVISDVLTLSIPGSFTVAGWFKLESTLAQIFTVCSKWGSTPDRVWYLHYQGFATPPQCEFIISQDGTAAGGINLLTPTMAIDGLWHFLVGWYDFDAHTISIQLDNGTPAVISGVAPGPVHAGTKQIHPLIYTDGTAAQFSNGLLDEVGLWSRVLSTAERAHLWNGGLGRTHPF